MCCVVFFRLFLVAAASDVDATVAAAVAWPLKQTWRGGGAHIHGYVRAHAHARSSYRSATRARNAFAYSKMQCAVNDERAHNEHTRGY